VLVEVAEDEELRGGGRGEVGGVAGGLVGGDFWS